MAGRARGAAGASGDESPGNRAAFVEQVCTLYERVGLSTRRIADALGVNRRHVDAALREAGVRVSARGAGRGRPLARRPVPDDLAEQLRRLYVDERLTRREVSEKLGLSEGLVRTRLAEENIVMRPRGRYFREDRQRLAWDQLVRYYRDRGMTAAAVAERLGISLKVVLRAAHDDGLPVRPGSATAREVGTIELIDALYADPVISSALARHGVPVVPAGGPIWVRFPEPVRLSSELCAELYTDCGASMTQIELLTGQPASTIARYLHSAGVQVRTAGGRSPFRRRWEAARRERGE